MEANTTALKQFIKQLPKIELHAHLNGCIRESTIVDLVKQRPDLFPDSNILNSVTVSGKRSLKECFDMFLVIHKVSDSLEVIKRIAYEMCEDFASQNCKYLEIRTTPKPLKDKTSKDYVQCVLDAIQEFHSKHPNAMIEINVLLSINRMNPSLERAKETVELAAEFKGKGVVGLDFCGDCYCSDFDHFASVFEYARTNYGLSTAVHMAEIKNDKDTEAILKFKPERVGHAYTMNETHFQQLLENKIPVEICLTGNAKVNPEGYTFEECLQNHPVQRYIQHNHPITLCTDDTGVFQNNLCQEYEHFIHEIYCNNYLKISNQQVDELKQKLFELSQGSIEYCFCSVETKTKLTALWKQFATEQQLKA